MSSGTVAVAMSGGIDSTAAAAMLLERGHALIGLTLRTFPCDPSAPDESIQACCGSEDIEVAKAAAAAMGFPHYVLEGADLFRSSVVEYAHAEYLRGRTPNPCSVCNRDVRFGFMLARALQIGAGRLATGHHARVDEVSGRFRILKGRDGRKDQSYFLGFLPQESLSNALFPVGEITKDEARRILGRLDLPNKDRAESQDLCFRKLMPSWGGSPCRLKDAAGKDVGQGGPIQGYTVGMRRGLGLGGRGAPLYVLSIDAGSGVVTVGPEEALFRGALFASGVNWVSIPEPGRPIACDVKIRYRHPGAAATVATIGQGRVRVDFTSPQRAVAPGQAAAFYDGDVLLGAGFIDS